MALKKGDRLNPNGRPKGSENKLNADLRSKLKNIIENNIDNVQSYLHKLKPIERLQVIERLLSFVLPKLQAQTIELDMNSLSDAQVDEIINSIQIDEKLVTIKIVDE